MEANLTNIDGKSKFKDVSIAPMHTAEHILNCSLPYRGGKFTLIGNDTLLPVLISHVG